MRTPSFAMPPHALNSLSARFSRQESQGHSTPRDATGIETLLGSGSYLQEFQNLRRESDPSLFEEGLYNLGVRLENGDRMDAAVGVFGYLAHLPVSTASGIPQQARQRLEAIAGTGSPALRAEFLLRRLVQESAEPSTLIGMGVAGAAFRLTRAAVMTRLASLPGGFFARGIGLRALGGFAGYAVEGLAFPLATRSANAVLGRDLEWNAPTLAREIASSYLFLGALRLSGFASTRGMNAALANSESSAWQSATRTLFPQAGMLGGIFLSHQAEIALGLRPHLDNATTLVDSLAQLLQFNLAGRFTRVAFGPGFHAWEQSIDLQAETIATSPARLPLELGPTLAWAHAMGESPSRDSLSMMSGNERGGGSGHDPATEIERIPDLMRQFADAGFKERLQQGDLLYRLREAFPADIEARAQGLLSFLNILAASQRLNIPIGRRITIQSAANRDRILFRKATATEFRFSMALSAEPAPSFSHSEVDPIAPQVPAIPSAPRRIELRASAISAARKIDNGLPKILRSLEELRAHLRQVGEPSGTVGASYEYILEVADDANPNTLSLASRNIVFPTGTTVRVMAAVPKRTFNATEHSGALNWDRGTTLSWSAAQGRALFNDLVLKGATEAYQQIEAYSRDPKRMLNEESRFRLTDEIADPRELSTFLLAGLNRYMLKGATLSVNFSGWQGDLLFRRSTKGIWAQTGANPIRVVVPTAPEPRAPAPSLPIAEDNGPRPTLLRSLAIPILHRTGLNHLGSLLSRAYQDGTPEDGPQIMIFEDSGPDTEGRLPTPLSAAILNQATKGPVEFKSGTNFQIIDMRQRCTFVGKVSLTRHLTWAAGSGNEWHVAGLRAMRHQEVRLKTPLELYLYLEALPNQSRRDPTTTDSAMRQREISILWEGPMPPTVKMDLKTYIFYSLISHVPHGKSLTVRFSGGEAPIKMENYMGDLWMEEAKPDLDPQNPEPPPRENE